MEIKQILRTMALLVMALALALGLWGVLPAPVAMAATCTSRGDGNWDATATWDGCNNTIPQNGDDVVIGIGHTVIVNADTATLNSLTVNGTLRFDNSGVGKSMTVTDNTVVGSSGRLDVATGGSATTHSLTLGGDLTNNGTFDGLPAAGRIINVTFNNSSADQTISGESPSQTKFNQITLDKGVPTRRVVSSIGITIGCGSQCVTWTNGTWEQTDGRLTFNSGNQAITASGRLILSSNGSATFPSSITGTGTNTGFVGTLIVNTTGDLTVGAGNNRLQVGDNTIGGTAIFTAGTINVRGRLTLTNGTVTINGATINIDPQASYSLVGTSNVLEAVGAVNVTMSAGSIVIVDPLSTSESGREIMLESGTGTKTFSGGTVYLGDGTSSTSGSSDGFEVATGGITLYNFVVNNQQGGTNRIVNLGNVQGTPAPSHLTLDGNLNIETGGMLNGNVGTESNITLRGNWTNSGIFTAGSGTVTFNRTGEQTIGGDSVTTFNNLMINNGATVVIPTSNTPTISTLTNNGTLRQTRYVGTGNTAFLNLGTAHYGVEIDPDTTAMGDTTVTIGGNQFCPNITIGVERCFEIDPASSQTATVRFYFTEAERNDETLDDLKVWHWNGSMWTLEMGATSTDGSGNAQWVQVAGVDAYSPFSLSEDTPTAVDLARFEATPQDNAILVTWETATELDNAGFNLYRSTAAAGPYTLLNATLIPPQFPGEAMGGDYEWLDTDVQPDVTYFYKLEDIDVKGVSTFHGPISAASIAAPTAVGLRNVSARGETISLTLGLTMLLALALVFRRR